jgi:predicted nucleic acid-binding protein
LRSWNADELLLDEEPAAVVVVVLGVTVGPRVGVVVEAVEMGFSTG